MSGAVRPPVVRQRNAVNVSEFRERRRPRGARRAESFARSRTQRRGAKGWRVGTRARGGNSEARLSVTAIRCRAVVICGHVQKHIGQRGAGKACRKRYCQLDWCFGAARRAIIRKGRTTSVHHIWQTFPNMVTSTSKYGSRGRPLGVRCTTARRCTRPNIGGTERHRRVSAAATGNSDASRFFHVDFGANPHTWPAAPLRRTTFSRRGRTTAALVGVEPTAARSDTRRQ